MMPADGRGHELRPAMACITSHDIYDALPVPDVLADIARRLATRPVKARAKCKPSTKLVTRRKRARAKP
jgi:hypothetical protein